MGARANLVWKEKDEIKIYYSGRKGQFTDYIVEQGLDFCRDYFPIFHEEPYLMTNAYAEGSIMIDVDQKHVILFGGGDVNNFPCFRRHYLKRVRPKWPSWTIRWSVQGNSDIAEYLGLDKDRILEQSFKPDFERYLQKTEWTGFEQNQFAVVTIICDGIIKDYWADSPLENAIVLGEKLKDVIPSEQLITHWLKEDETEDSLLADYNHKKLFVCWGRPYDDRCIQRTEEFWKGWEVIRQEDGLIFNFIHTNRDTTPIEMTDEEFDNSRRNFFDFDSKAFESM
jgi:hypothetical protein